MRMTFSTVTQRSYSRFFVVFCFLIVVAKSVSANSHVGEQWEQILSSVSGSNQATAFVWEYSHKGFVQETINVRYDSERWYFRRENESGNFYEEAFDCLRTQQLHGNPSLNKYHAVTGPGAYFNPKQTELWSHLMPFEFSYGLLGVRLDKFAFVEEDVREENQVLIGLRQIYSLRPSKEPAPSGQIVVEVFPADPKRFNRYLLWVDPERGCAVISRKQFSPDGHLVSELHGEDYSNCGGGIWVPETIRGIWYARDRQSQNRIEQYKVVIQTESIKINPKFNQGDFEVVIPPGASIHEYRFGQSVTGPLEMVLQEIPDEFLDLGNFKVADTIQQSQIPSDQETVKQTTKEVARLSQKKPNKVGSKIVSDSHMAGGETGRQSVSSARTLFCSAVVILVIASSAWMLLSKRRKRAQ